MCYRSSPTIVMHTYSIVVTFIYFYLLLCAWVVKESSGIYTSTIDDNNIISWKHTTVVDFPGAWLLDEQFVASAIVRRPPAITFLELF